jgi:hypothetical protein
MDSCVALNPNITGIGTSSYFNRVMGYASSTNNYGRSKMKRNGSSYTWTDNTANGRGGADTTSTDWEDASWWTGTAVFDPTVWDIVNGSLPTLRNMP